MLSYRTYILDESTDWVVFVHGAGGNSSIWFRQLRAFREHFNVLMVDLRGHGESAQLGGDRQPYTFETVSADVVEVLDHLGIESAHFVGISLGCLIIRTIAEVAPERVSSMVLGGAIVRLNLRSRFLVTMGNALNRVMPFMWLYRLFAWVIMPRQRHRESRMLFVREAQKLARKEFLRWYRLSLEMTPLARLFEEPEAPAPTLYLMGDEDYMFLPAVRRIAAHQRRALLQVIVRSGHVCNVDQAELFNRHSIDFLKDPAVATA
ncbi:MAG: alpha/beta hydrolase [Gemmatimonadota bacterium]